MGEFRNYGKDGSCIFLILLYVFSLLHLTDLFTELLFNVCNIYTLMWNVKVQLQVQELAISSSIQDIKWSLFFVTSQSYADGKTLYIYN